MILLWGAADDPPLQSVRAELELQGVDACCLYDDALDRLDYNFDLVSMRGWLRCAERRIAIEDLRGMYLRPGNPAPGRAMNAAASLLALAARAAVPVVNRPAAGASNLSKPYQLRLLAQAGLAVPETLVTTDPQAARNFLTEHRRLVYKSVSGVRSIVATLDECDRERLQGVRSGPVQLQRWIAGRDVRVHVVGNLWFATAIECEADDYRYAARDGGSVSMSACEIPDSLGQRLVTLTQSMGLLVSGVDLRVSPDGCWYCFEVNPSPGFTFYEEQTGQPITDAIASLLTHQASATTSRCRRTPPAQTTSSWDVFART